MLGFEKLLVNDNGLHNLECKSFLMPRTTKCPELLNAGAGQGVSAKAGGLSQGFSKPC